jgi:putative flippase GtrA
MSVFARWLRFNLVGVMGMAVQFSVLALLNRSLPGHYLVATATAVECAVLHNFVWHVRFTWRGRCNEASMLAQLLRFHLSNGAISLFGNLALMRLLHQARLPLLVANAMAVLCCSLANFYLGERWAFRVRADDRSSRSGGRSSKVGVS